jgi:hypothetical protein
VDREDWIDVNDDLPCDGKHDDLSCKGKQVIAFRPLMPELQNTVITEFTCGKKFSCFGVVSHWMPKPAKPANNS